IIDIRIDEFGKLLLFENIPWSSEIQKLLPSFIKKGKSVRSVIFLALCDYFSKKISLEDISLAAILEYFHAALLIHDDLIDHDELRRGDLSVHKKYEQRAVQENLIHPKEFGENVALCFGDISIFGGYLFFSQLSYPPEKKQNILQAISQEFLCVGYGELHDITLTHSINIPTRDEILEMYRYKTARYTFSLPFRLACLVSEQNQTMMDNLAQLGEILGLLFQITDDMLTLIGDQKTVGKTIGNDISENKKTLYAVLLYERANQEDLQKLQSIFGKPTVTHENISAILKCMKTYNVDEEMQKIIDHLKNQATEIIRNLPSPSMFEEILRFILTRKK
ncbi:MAG: polyprenyl synthetase family protein, partial [Patescibacteria group bacterium]|nr:polyprenyl synthetase family protein [Patescibacteria group bacterium]